MLGKIRVLTILIILTFLFVNSAIASASENWELTPFKGLTSVAVLIEDLGEDAKKAGFSEEELKNYIELKLCKIGVGVD